MITAVQHHGEANQALCSCKVWCQSKQNMQVQGMLEAKEAHHTTAQRDALCADDSPCLERCPEFPGAAHAAAEQLLCSQSSF